MRLTVTERYHAVVVTLEGELLGSLHGPTFRDAIQDLIARQRLNVVVDLGSTTLMDSSGIGALIEAATALRAVGGDLRIAAIENRMRNLFVMTRLLGRVFTLYPTVDEAAESYALGAASVAPASV